MSKTEWRATDDPWWLLRAVLAVVAATAGLLILVLLVQAPLNLLVAPVVISALQLGAALRARMRLTAEGIEVRRLRTRTYRWSDIESVQRAPAWDSSSSIWLRLRGSWPQSEPEVLVPPGRKTRGGDEQTLNDIVALMQERVEQNDSAADSAQQPGRSTQ